MENAEQIVNQKMKELKLTPLEKVSDFINKNKRFYAAPVYDKNHEKVFFKILIVESSVSAESVKKEIKIRNLMLHFQDKIAFPHLIKSNNQKLPYWFVSQYLEGKILGFLYELYDEREEIISLLVKTLVALHNITEETLNPILKDDFFLKKDGFGEPLTILKSFENKLSEETKLKINFLRASEFIKEREKYFKNHKVVLAHADYTLNNMVISNNTLILTDWESAFLSNIANDIAHLWIQLWRYPIWRQKLLSQYVSTLAEEEITEFKNLFEAKIVFEALAELIWNIKICPLQYQESQIRKNIETINTVFEGFDELLKI